MGKIATSDLYTVAPSGSEIGQFCWALFISFSILPFYLMLTATVILAWQLILPSVTPAEALL